MLKILQNYYPQASAIHIQKKDILHAKIVIKTDSSLFIRVPTHFSEMQIADFIYTNHNWILSTLKDTYLRHNHLESTLASHDNQIPIFGIWHDINKLLEPYVLKTPRSLTLKTELKNKLSEYISSRAAQYALLMQLSYRSIKITHATSRFACCTYCNDLRFSLMLIFAKKELIDYVIIHELAHIRHKNHSPAFWEYVMQYCQNAKILRKTLTQEARIYPLLLKRISSI